jgi:hypothetical protein
MTAIEWFLSQKMALTSEEFDDIIQQAIEMEKQQIIDAFQYKFFHPYVENEPEQYYNQTYKPSA